MSDTREHLKIRRSYHVSGPSKALDDCNVYSKSDLDVTHSNIITKPKSYDRNHKSILRSTVSHEQYYKKYEHDEIPVKESSIHSPPGDKGSLTNSDLDRLETRIFKNVSQELQTEESSLSSLESNIKFFKTTVEKIFDNFYTSMSDFDHYKKRFHEILAKSKEDAFEDMEDFIKDMFEHITSSESSTRNLTEEAKAPCVTSSSGDTCTEQDNTTVTEAYKNDNYFTDSTLDAKSSKTKDRLKITDIFNIFLLDGNPCVQINMKDRSMFSEMNLKKPKKCAETVASADNIKKLAAKKLEVEQYVQQDHYVPDRDIPVKVSFAKKNIHLNEDFARIDDTENTKSFLSKICGLLCKKFRKNTFG